MLQKKMSMFDTFKVKKPQRSTFNLSHKHETTVNIGDINCLHWNWCYPGDRFKIRYSFLAKFSPMIAPNFSRMRLKSEVFYVPLADIYPNFHDVLMNYKETSSQVTENGRTTTFNFTQFPHLLLNRFAWWFNKDEMSSVGYSDYLTAITNNSVTQKIACSRLLNQLGLPFDICSPYYESGTVNPYAKNTLYLDASVSDVVHFNPSGQVPVSILPAQAYQYVYNWYYRDSVRSPEVDIYPNVYSFSGGSEFVTLKALFNDQFSTVNLNVAAYAADLPNRFVNSFFNSVFQIRRRFYKKDYFNTAVSDPTVGVDSVAVPDNIVDLRKANSLQKFIEKQALAGNRVAEFIMAHWAHKVDNYELGRPILISSSSQNVQISEVLQTSETTDESAQGTRSGNANSYGNSNGAFFVSPDYGILLINLTVVPEISYFSGMPRKLAVKRWEHLAWPEFSQIGMQPIYKFELGKMVYESPALMPTQHLEVEDLDVFGYAPRYSEYKMELDQVSGEMATSLRYWHQSPTFSQAPGLNSQFGLIGFKDYNRSDLYSANEYYNQIFAIADDEVGDHCQIIANFDITVNRALPANDMPLL